MELIRHLPFRRPARTRSRPPARTPRRGPVASDPPTLEMRRAQRTPAPEDRAFYTCGCGYAFVAKVTTSVACPHCGSGQAW